MFKRNLFYLFAEKMKILAVAGVCALMLSCSFLFSGHKIHAFSYDYSATTECLIEPQRAQYGGGIIVNPDFNHGTEGWTVIGQGEMREGVSNSGNRYMVAYNRTRPLDSVSQKVQLEKGKHYCVSAWVQFSEGSDTVAIVFKSNHGEMIRSGKAIARNGCWSLLKGGIFANYSAPIEILFESKNTRTEMWVDNVSLQPFTMDQWRSHQEKSIDKERKSKVKFQVIYSNGTSVEGAIVSVNQTKSNFPFGCGMNHNIINSTDYQNWFTSRFKYTTFTNEMKWYSTERIQGQENYAVADTMVRLAKQNGISIRGHNILWDDPKYQQRWVRNLTSDELRKAATKRINSVVSRYSGQLIAWDVMNENLHFSFYEEKFGKNASAEYFLRAYQLDPKTRMFMNEFNTIEYCSDDDAYPINYKNKLEDILSYPGNQGILAGIGVQGHFGIGNPNLAYMRSALDILGTAGLPIWLTEVDVSRHPNQAKYLELILREGFSHPAVKGIIMFAGPAKAGFNVTTLADNDFKNTATGDVVDKLINEWESHTINFITDGKGFFEISLYHGDYNLTVKDPVTNSSTSLSYEVTKDVTGSTVYIHIDV